MGSTRKSSALILATAFALMALIYGAVSLPRYGLTYDTPALFYAGDRTLYWMEHPTVDGALDFTRHEDPPGFKTRYPRIPAFEDPMHYPVLPGLVCAVTSSIFHDRLGLLRDTDGHHLGLVLLHAVGLFFFCVYLNRLLGPVASASGTAALTLFPSALAHSFNNAKDWPCAEYYGLAVLAAGLGVVTGRARHLLWAGVFLGVSLACKLNGIFVLPTFYLWLPIAFAFLHRGRRRMAPGVAAMSFAFPYVGGVVFVLLWPWLLQGGSAAASWDHLSDYIHHMVHFGVGDRRQWTSYPVCALLFMTPPLVLGLALVQLVYGRTRTDYRPAREAAAIGCLFLLWAGLPLLREALPRSRYYDANRHFIEYVPGLCAMAGAGADRAVTAIRAACAGRGLSLRAESAIVAMAATLGLICLVWPVVQYRPYEVTYYNSFIGGLGGAQRNLVFKDGPRPMGGEGDYWYSTTREAMAFAKSYLSETHAVGSCGPYGTQINMNRGDVEKLTVTTEYRNLAAFDSASVVYAVPHPVHCKWSTVRALERERPILHRVEREGGLVYEVLGPRDGKEHPVVTPQKPED